MAQYPKPEKLGVLADFVRTGLLALPVAASTIASRTIAPSLRYTHRARECSNVLSIGG